jgi:hypothetical protein
VPRSRAQRKADTLALLRTEVDCWVASADGMGNTHLVPLSHYWDGAALVLATPRSSPTATNLLRAGAARVGVGYPICASSNGISVDRIRIWRFTIKTARSTRFF